MKIPTVKRFIIFFLQDLLENVAKTISDQQQLYGDIFQKKILGQCYYFVCHPKIAEHILLKKQDNYIRHPNINKNLGGIIGKDNLITTNDKKLWMHDRPLAQRSFESSVYFETYADEFAKNGNDACDAWEKTITKEGSSFPIVDEIRKLFFKNMQTTVFKDINFDEDRLIKSIPEIMRLAMDKSASITKLPWIFPTKRKRNYFQYIQFLQDEVAKIFETRLQSCVDVDDLLGNFIHDAGIKVATDPRCKAIGSQILSFNIVGFITSVSSLSFIIVGLIQNPEWMKKIEEEVALVCKNELPTYADFLNLKITKAFISEILRLYPGFSIIMRESIKEDVFEGYYFPEKIGFMFSLYHIHRHKDFWEEPEKFKPERFLSKRFGQDEQSAYMPFGLGPRSCIAKNFMMLELTIITALIVRRFSITAPKDFELQLKFTAGIFMSPNLENIFLKPK